jgi:glutathione S-transferase
MNLCHQATEAGFATYEAIVSRTAGAFSLGDKITLADLCLVPAAWSAARSNVDVVNYPTIVGILARMEQEEAVKKHTGGTSQIPGPNWIKWSCKCAGLSGSYCLF